MEEGQEVIQSRCRWNGWACPWHPLQCLAWFFIFMFAFLHFGVFGHYILGYWRVLIFVVPGLLFLILVISLVVATSINPAEPAVREKQARGQFFRPKFDRSKFPHVIHNSYCQLCQVHVTSSAKHCKICDKCIMDFDHHCKWLNNCVGSRNYKWFLATVWSAITALFLYLLYTLSLFVVYFIGDDASLLRFNCNFPSNLSACDPTLNVLGLPLPSAANPVFPTLCALFAFLAVLGLGFLLHLAIFHIYLKLKGQTTYGYFVERRNSKSESSVSGTMPRQHWKFFTAKGNRVTPSGEDAKGHSIAPPNFVSTTSLVHATTLEQGASQEQPSSYHSSLHSSVLSDQSYGSAGATTFGRTPSPYELDDDSYENLTDEQKLLRVQGAAAKVVEDCHHPPQAPLSESDELLVQALMVPPSTKDSTRPSAATKEAQQANPSPPLTPPSQIKVYRDSSDKGHSGDEGVAWSKKDGGQSTSGSLLSPNKKLATPTSTLSAVHTTTSHVTSHVTSFSPPSPLTQHSNTPSSVVIESTSPSEQPQNATPSTKHETSIQSEGLASDISDKAKSQTVVGSDLREIPIPPVSAPPGPALSDTPLLSASTTGSPSPHAESAMQKRVSFQQRGPQHSKVRPLPPIGMDVEYSSVDSDGSMPTKKGRCLPPLPPAQSDASSIHSGISSLRGSTYSLPLPDARYSNSSRSNLSPTSSPSQNPDDEPSRAATAGKKRGRGRRGAGRKQLNVDALTDEPSGAVSSVPDILSVNSVSEC